MIKKYELLAPAGDLERLKWAILYGADAIYIGGDNYSLRANAKNFTMEDIKKGVKYAHEHGVKVYVAVNIVFHNDDVRGLENYLKDLYSANIDAIIISDPVVIDISKKVVPNLELHLSTQQSILNKDAALYFQNHGVKRIVLARECSKEDIKDIIDNTDVEIECFIHGAMCTNLSGRCVLSNYFTNRDANRGGCCQVCRFNFNLFNKSKQISNNEDFTISPKDLSLVNQMHEMMDIGVSSFKLEGRMRSIYYIATLLSVYRKLIDLYCKNIFDDAYIKTAEKILYRCSNRDVAPQFFDKKPGVEEQYYSVRQEDSNQDFLGIVLEYDSEKKEVTIEQRNFFKIGDEVSIFGPLGQDVFVKIKYILDENNLELDAARHPRQIVKINCESNVSKNHLMRVNFFD
ncbi:MAG: U32 family peptidase [Bacilli bacterium]